MTVKPVFAVGEVGEVTNSVDLLRDDEFFDLLDDTFRTNGIRQSRDDDSLVSGRTCSMRVAARIRNAPLPVA